MTHIPHGIKENFEEDKITIQNWILETMKVEITCVQHLILTEEIHQKYQERKMKMVEEAEGNAHTSYSINEYALFHVTRKNLVRNIIQNNIRPTFSSRRRYGRGTTFSDVAAIANKYTNLKIGSDDANDRVILICKVIMGRMNKISPFSFVPQPDGADTYRSVDSLLWVKFNKDEYFPLYAVHFKYPQYDQWNTITQTSTESTGILS